MAFGFKVVPTYMLSWAKLTDDRTGDIVTGMVKLTVTNIEMGHVCFTAEVSRHNLPLVIEDIREDFPNLEYQEEADCISIAELIEARLL